MNPYDHIYRATSYVVDTQPEPIVLRIGRHNPALDMLLAEHGAATCAFITAWNPMSVEECPEENLGRNERLVSAIKEMGYAMITGRGIGDEEGWTPEESFLVIGITPEEALELGRRFAQRAIVTARAGEAPALLWC